MNSITIVGDGAFGTACAQAFAHQGHQVVLWCYNTDIAHDIQCNRMNSRYLPGIMLHTNIVPTTDLSVALENTYIFEALPMAFLRSVLNLIAPYKTDKHFWISLTKGIEANTLFLATQVIENVLAVSQDRIATLSGPSYATELAKNCLTGMTIASANPEFAQKIALMLNKKNLIIEQSSDVIGVQLIAALKNVCAIALGIMEGAHSSHNTKILLFMRLMSEMEQILTVYNINYLTKNETLYGLAGLGDILLTCFGCLSRNYKLGYGLGQGKKLHLVLDELKCEPEGLHTLLSIEKLARQHDVSLECFTAIHHIVYDKQSVDNLIDLLRP